MKRAHNRDAVVNEKYYFRKQVYRTRSRHYARGTSARNASRTPSRTNSPGPMRTNHLRNSHDTVPSSPLRGSRPASPDFGPVEEEYCEYTLDEIINGTKDNPDEFPGLVNLVYNYLDSLNVDVETSLQLGLYLDLVSARANGSLMTTASWIRQYVRSHPEYKFDSVVSSKINYDMIKKLDEIERGIVEAPGLLPSGYAKRRTESETS